PVGLRICAGHRRAGVSPVRPVRYYKNGEGLMQQAQVNHAFGAPHATDAVSRSIDVAIVLLLTLGAAALLWVFLLAESSVVVIGLLAAFAIALVLVQRRPLFEQRLISAFRRQRVTAIVAGVTVAVVFPWLL